MHRRGLFQKFDPSRRVAKKCSSKLVLGILWHTGTSGRFTVCRKNSVSVRSVPVTLAAGPWAAIWIVYPLDAFPSRPRLGGDFGRQGLVAMLLPELLFVNAALVLVL